MENNETCWHQQYVVDEMNRFVDKHIKNHDITEHFRPFTELLAICEKGSMLLDIGTGTAMIADFCKDHKFHGADLPHIISGCAMRNQPGYFYRSCDVIEDELAWIKKFDIIVLNGVIDIMANGLGILARVLTHANRYVLIHRQEITEHGVTTYKENGSYGGKTFHSIINRNDFNQLVDQMGFDILAERKLNFGNWENGGCSFLLANRNPDFLKFDSHPLRQLRNRISDATPLKVIIGGGDVKFDKDWIITNVEELDVENSVDWYFLFEDKKADNLFAEHVWEHLANPERAIRNCYDYLRSGGVLRIAVPDGLHPSQYYIDSVKPGGTGAGADDHKYLYNYNNLSKMLEKAGFKVELVEFWNEHKTFSAQAKESIDRGIVKRSLKYDERNLDSSGTKSPNYTSLIIDAIKS